MEFSYYSQAVPDIAMSPDECSDGSSTSIMQNIEDEFDIGDLPVKLELRYAIEAKRAEKGLDMPVMDEVPKLSRQLTADEEERRRVRRERNKVAASRCRVKRKHHVRKLLKESDELTKSNNYLEAVIDKLQNEKLLLEKAIRTHDCMNPRLLKRMTDVRCPGS